MGYQATNYNITNYIWDAKKPTTITKLVGGFNHLEKYESQWEGLSHILWKIKHVPNHQSVNIWVSIVMGLPQVRWMDEAKLQQVPWLELDPERHPSSECSKEWCRPRHGASESTHTYVYGWWYTYPSEK
jgi:hypothetical protein